MYCINEKRWLVDIGLTRLDIGFMDAQSKQMIGRLEWINEWIETCKQWVYVKMNGCMHM